MHFSPVNMRLATSAALDVELDTRPVLDLFFKKALRQCFQEFKRKTLSLFGTFFRFSPEYRVTNRVNKIMPLPCKIEVRPVAMLFHADTAERLSSYQASIVQQFKVV